MTIAARFLTALLALLLAAPVFAQAPQRSYSRAEFDQMLAPVALYPDALLSQVLMAATYPAEVNEAARWTRANPGLQGDEAVRAAQYHDWDPSVISLVAFPQVLQRMEENPDWTHRLGDAFLAQEPQVTDTVQQLRHRAQAAGNLQSNEQMYVQQQGQAILLQPAAPQYVYVPYYDPMVVYGPWWWPAYRPVAWAPWPGYARPYRPGSSFAFWWGRPVGLSLNFFFGDFDWHRRHVHVVRSNAFYYRAPAFSNRTVAAESGRWQHDPQHRRSVEYRAAAVPQRFAGAQVERREAQRTERQIVAPVAAPVVAPAQAQPRAERRIDQRNERREERRAERPAAPAVAPVQVRPQMAVQPTVERRDDRRADRREERQATRVQARPAPAPVVQAQPQRAAMPAAQAPQTPRADRRGDRRGDRDERRSELGQKG
ncbi:MAG: DUF3300 domain-containing protein [Betaproteobacteria bacterium]